jgi:transcriptional regulator with PAS, ATPase and Fis domain
MESILFVAPFKEIADVAKRVILEMELSIPVIIANNETALLAIKKFPDVSVLISRGGTATDLKVLPEKTIVEINTSFTDILLILEKALCKGYKRIAIVTKDNIIDNIKTDFNFLGVQIQVRPCNSDSEIAKRVRFLEKEGIDCIIGCKRAVEAADACGVHHAYIESGEISIRKAIKEAQNIVHSKGIAALQLERMNAIINNIQEGVVILDREQKPIFSNRLANEILNDENDFDWRQDILKKIEGVHKEKILEIGDNQILLKSISLEVYNQYKNDVWIFQEISRIEKNERKIRLSMYNKGFYAKWHFADIITHSPVMEHVIMTAQKFAAVKSNVLIYGDTGTGKEGLAQSIHNASQRAQEPFISVNCASLPPNLIESELFGYAEGAFTGARKSGKRGLFELAHKGTIFLDEIGEMPLAVQSRLLRVLQEREIMRIGDDKIVPLDIRVICATNKDLLKLSQTGKFRFDLYYRINVLKLQLPSLKERREDIMPIFNYYLRKYHTDPNDFPQLDTKSEKILMEYSWPGNIRELKNVAEVLAFESGVVDAKQAASILEPVVESEGAEIHLSANLSLKEMEREIIRHLLKVHTAEEVCAKMGISRVTLWRKTK